MEADASYLLITCMSTGSPWSEQEEGTSFDVYMKSAFGRPFMFARPAAGQDAEFCCGFPISSGSNCLYKPRKACRVSITAETPRILLSVRSIWASHDRDEVESQWSENGMKVWIAIRVPQQVAIPARCSNDRLSPKRRRPEEISHFLGETFLDRLRERLHQRL